MNYTHDAAGQLVSDSTGINYTYDGAGNLIATTSRDAYTYNSWGNLTAATVEGTTTTASFDTTGNSRSWSYDGGGRVTSHHQLLL